MPLPKLPELPVVKSSARMPKLPKLPEPRQQVQGPRGDGQGWWGIYAPKIAPMSNRRKPKEGV